MKRIWRLAVILPILATIAIVLAGIGWLVQGVSPGDALFRSLHVLSAGGDYEESDKWIGNHWIGAARWFGLVFFILTALKAFRLLLAKQWRELRAQLTRRDLVLVGDHPTLAALARLLAKRRAVLWFPGAGAVDTDGVRIIEREWQATMIRRFRFGRAKAIIVAYRDDDLRALDVARIIARAARDPEIGLLSSDLSLPTGFALTAELERIRLLSPEQLAIRSAHDAFPPFDIAQRLGQRRINAVLMGCGRMGERVIADILLASLTSFLERPRLTIIDPRAETIRVSLLARSPEIEKSIDLTFSVPPPTGDPHVLPLEQLRAVREQDELTCAYVCLGSDQASLAAALALEDVARREGWGIGTIFVRQKGSTALDAGSVDTFGTLVPIGRGDQLADALGLLGAEPDMLARRLHDAYRAAAPADAAANVDWDALPENLREANRRAFAHLPAKLASAGVSVDLWLAARRARDTKAMLPRFPDLDADPVLAHRLAVLEHERWMAERRLAGWQFGATRDDARRRHPDLVPFDKLSQRSKSYDVTMIEVLAASL